MGPHSRYVEVTPARLYAVVARSAFVAGLALIAARLTADSLAEVDAIDAVAFPAFGALLFGGAAALAVRAWWRARQLHAGAPSARWMMGAFGPVPSDVAGVVRAQLEEGLNALPVLQQVIVTLDREQLAVTPAYGDGGFVLAREDYRGLDAKSGPYGVIWFEIQHAREDLPPLGLRPLGRRAAFQRWLDAHGWDSWP